MSAAIKSEVSNPYLRSAADLERRRQVETRRAQLQSSPKSSPVSPLVTPPRPIWLSACITLRHLSTASALVLGTTLLPIYGWSVFNQHHWGESYEKLANLQQQERQLLASIEVRKYQVAEQAEHQPARLVRQVPANTLFLAPASTRSEQFIRPQPAPVLSVVPLSPVSY